MRWKTTRPWSVQGMCVRTQPKLVSTLSFMPCSNSFGLGPKVMTAVLEQGGSLFSSERQHSPIIVIRDQQFRSCSWCVDRSKHSKSYWTIPLRRLHCSDINPGVCHGTGCNLNVLVRAGARQRGRFDHGGSNETTRRDCTFISQTT